MKSILTAAIFISFLSFSNIYAQDMRAEIGGNTSSNGFSVINAAGDTLFRVTGEGNIGFGKGNPEYLLDVFQKFGDVARSINLRAGSRPNSDGGSINLYAGDGGENGNYPGGEINIVGGEGTSVGGNVNITAGDGPQPGEIFIKSGTGTQSMGGGSINIISNNGHDHAGDINLITNYNLHGYDGRIKVLSGFSEDEASPISPNCGILLQTHNVRNSLAPRYQGIKLITGNNTTDYNDVDITLKAGDGEIGYNGSGGNVQLTPGIASGTGVDGLVLVNGSGTYTGSWTQASDQRFKKNIKPLENSLEQIEKLNPISYELKKDEFPEKKFSDKEQIGLIAQEVEKVIPVLVKTDSEGYKSIDYAKINVLLIDAIKEQQKSINELRKEIDTLKSKFETEVSSSALSSN